MGTIQIDGSTPKLTIGNATAEDALILFDGNAQDFHIGLDDTADDLVIGVGSALGTTTALAIDENAGSTFSGTVTVGVDDTGKDVKLFGATSGSFLLWDESADALLLTDSTPIQIGDAQDLTLYHDGSHSYITNKTGTMKLATETSGIAVTIGHTTSEVTIADNLTVTGTVTLADGSIALADLDIDGGTDIGAALVDADEIIVDDGGGGTNRRCDMSRVKTYVGALGNVVEDTSPQLGADLDMNDNALVFPGTYAAGPGSTSLDDYEEGTWTPVVSFGGNSVSVTFSAGWQGGVYTKIGNLVTVSTMVILTSNGSSTGNVKISGMPFTNQNAVAHTTCAAFFASSVSFANQMMVTMERNSTSVDWKEMTEAGTVTFLQETNVPDNAQLSFQLSYHVEGG